MFSPTNQRITISVDAGVDGPTDGQRGLFKHIELKYDDLLPVIGPRSAIARIFALRENGRTEKRAELQSDDIC
jgi:hypothetical protein